MFFALYVEAKESKKMSIALEALLSTPFKTLLSNVEVFHCCSLSIYIPTVFVVVVVLFVCFLQFSSPPNH